MSCYVDSPPSAPNLGGMRMCHLLADTHAELIAMVDRLGISRKYIQQAGTHREHFDISKGKRERAIEFGAIAITRSQLAGKLDAKRTEGEAA